MGVPHSLQDENVIRRLITSEPQTSRPQLNRRNTANIMENPWLITSIVVGSLIVTSLIIFLLARYVKTRWRQGKGFQPVKPREMASPYLGAGKLSPSDRRQVEDLERDALICKSLATRPLSTASGDIYQGLSMSNRDSHAEEEQSAEPGEAAGIKEDWKAWEARVLTERRYSVPGGLGLDQHPAFAPRQSGNTPNTPTNLRVEI
ncbi:hypothetical protein GGR50DRAFT_662392 [Xylaria sp. CBS 124048]|nr:hypothetical protein GGR50DRAFT_662392 [Xylaria sp. CBS 124048]